MFDRKVAQWANRWIDGQMGALLAEFELCLLALLPLSRDLASQRRDFTPQLLDQRGVAHLGVLPRVGRRQLRVDRSPLCLPPACFASL